MRSREDGYKGLCFAVRREDGNYRELEVEFPMSKKKTGNGSVQLPQRPQFSVAEIESAVRQAVVAGWDPESRGKAFVFQVPDL
jgi:hypothetical protein